MRFLIIAAVVLLTSLSHGQYAERYEFPLLNAFQSTLSFVFLKGPNGQKTSLANVNRVPIPAGYNGQTTFNYSVYKQNHTAPLIFLLVGLGGDAHSGVAKNIATELYKEGYHVAIIPSTFTEEFAVVGSGTPYVGQAAVDAAYLYEVLKSIKKQLPRKGVKVKGWGLTGYSFGALVGAHIALIDRSQEVFNFSKYVLVNPPVDLMYALRKLDGYYADFLRMDRKEKTNLVKGLVDFISQFTRAFDPEKYTAIMNSNALRELELRGLIGRAFHGILSGIVYISQQLGDLGILEGDDKSRRLQATRYGYQEYISLFMRTYYTRTRSGQEQWQQYYRTEAFDIDLLNRRNSLFGIRSELRTNGRITIIHNADDFLLGKGHVNFLQENLGERLILFPTGGHLGNIWHPVVRSAITDNFSEVF